MCVVVGKRRLYTRINREEDRIHVSMVSCALFVVWIYCVNRCHSR